MIYIFSVIRSRQMQVRDLDDTQWCHCVCTKDDIAYFLLGVSSTSNSSTPLSSTSQLCPNFLFAFLRFLSKMAIHVPRGRQNDASNGPSLLLPGPHQVGSAPSLAPALKLLRKRQGPCAPVLLEPAKSSPCVAYEVYKQVGAGNQGSRHMCAR